jgi:hypothetical protein
VVDDRMARIVLGADINDHLGHRLVVQGIPRLVVGGKVQQLKPQRAERTAVCAEVSVIVLVVSTKADGGPSTQLVVKLPALTLSLPGGWGVPNALVVVPGKR